MFSDFITPYLFFKNELDNFVNPTGSHEHWSMLILISGSYEVSMFGKNDIITNNDIYIFPAHINSKRNVLEHISYYALQFDINPTSIEAFNIPSGKTTIPDKKRLSYNLQLLDFYLDKNDTLANNVKSHILFDILYQISLNPVSSPKLINDPAVNYAINYIKENYTSKISLSDIAKELCITTSELIYKFKKHLGITPLEYIIDLKTNHAKNLLLQTTMSISQIAEECGYDNMYYFSNSFKKATGFPPSVYRNNYTL